ncbi:MAG: copper chaperone PCu(A)C [Gemmobacter sp.]|nr:copper chaperone PCu(A)C [Gemmobacter sp.]
MTIRSFALALALTSLASVAYAQDGLHIDDAYMRTSGNMATSGAAFMVIENNTSADDRIVSASSDVAERVELHTHKQDANGVMQMLEVPEGFVIPANGAHALERGGDHVMFLGLKSPLAHGDVVTVTLTFEKAGAMEVQIPVDLERKPMHGAKSGPMNHSGHGMKKTN